MTEQCPPHDWEKKEYQKGNDIRIEFRCANEDCMWHESPPNPEYCTKKVHRLDHENAVCADCGMSVDSFHNRDDVKYEMIDVGNMNITELRELMEAWEERLKQLLADKQLLEKAYTVLLDQPGEHKSLLGQIKKVFDREW